MYGSQDQYQAREFPEYCKARVDTVGGHCMAAALTLGIYCTSVASEDRSCSAWMCEDHGWPIEVECVQANHEQSRDAGSDCSICENGCIRGWYKKCKRPIPDTCDLCENGFFLSAIGGSDLCEAITICGADEVETEAPTITSDRVCEKCRENTFKNGDIDTTCDPHSYCGAGQFVARQDGTSDVECASCPDGSYQSSSQHRDKVCTKYSDIHCGAGEFYRAISISDVECAPCPDGSYQNNPRHQATCITAKTCNSNEIVGADTTATSDRVCTSFCTPGTYLKQGNGSTVCEVCPKNTFQDNPEHDNTTCNDHRVCKAGEYESLVPYITYDRNCSACPTGKYQHKTNHSIDECIEATVCGVGELTSAKHTPTSDTVCMAAATTTSTKTALAGAIAAFAVAAALSFVWHRRKLSAAERKVYDFKAEIERMIAAGELEPAQAEDRRVPREIRRGCVTLLERLGDGNFGEVWKAVLDESR